MKNSGQSFGRMKLLPALVLAAIAVSAHAAQSEAWVATATKAHDPRNAVHVAPLRAGEQVHIVVSLKLRNKDKLDALTNNMMAGKGNKPLTSAEFMERHAPTAAQAQKVVDYLHAQGFVNVTIADNRLLVEADGGAGSVKSAFKAELHEYNVDGRAAYANVTDALVPSHLGDTVLGVVGLQTVHVAHTHAKRLESTTDGAHTLTAGTAQGISIPNFPAIYGASSLPSASTATIGIITQGSVAQTLTDLASFASSAGYPAPSVTTTVVGTASSDKSGVDEWNMDSQSSLAAAGGTIKSMILYDINSLTDANLTSGYNKAVSDNKAKAINVSIGGCETDEGSVEATDDQIFQTAVAQGQTFSISSGDSGAYECGASAGKAQSYPAVSPYVMSLGGTKLFTNTSGNAWSGEEVWACASASACQASSSGGAGGGPSLTETAPSWQTAAGVLTSSKRGTPDISLDADPNSGAKVLVKGALVQIGGTSLAAPLFAGFWSRINAAHGNSLPFPAQTIYQGAATHANWFHDVTVGNQGYAAAAGWDYASGYGSIQVANLSSGFGSGGCTTNCVNANFTDTTSGLTATFTDASSDTGTGTINSYSWNFGDGQTSTTKSPVHTYASAGTYTVTETVGDSNGQSGTHSDSVTVGTITVPVERLTNGGFESTVSPWTVSTGVWCASSSASGCSGESPNSGSGFAWLNGYGTTHTDTAAQTITLSSTASSGTLSFYLHVDTKETTTSTAYDKLTVQLLSGSTVVATLGTYSNLNKGTGFTQKSFDISSYVSSHKGQSFTVKFTGAEDSSLATSFVIDDVSLKTN